MLVEPRCFARNCKNFIGVKDEVNELKQVPICGAFPTGILDEIAYGPNLHLKPIAGDHGIQFEKADDAE